MTVSQSPLSLFESVQATMGDRFLPFLVGGETFLAIEHVLARELERAERAAVFVNLPEGSGDLARELAHLDSVANASRHIYLVGGDELSRAPVPVHWHLFPYPSSSKLQRERFWLVLTESFATVMLGSQQSAPHLEGAPPLVAFSTCDPKAIAVASDVVLEAVAETQPKRVEAVRAVIDALPVSSPNTETVDRIVNATIQALGNAIRQHKPKAGQVGQERNRVATQTPDVDMARAMEAKDEFINTIAEKLCTPLTNIKTAIQLLRSPRIKESQKAKYWDVLNSECDRQISLIDSLTELIGTEVAPDAGGENSLLLFDIIPGVVSTFQAIAEEQGIMLAYTIPNTLPPADFPEADLKQILVKLIDNALQVTPAGGQIWVTANAPGEQLVQMEVRDTGLGIPPEAIPKIFDRFYRVSRTTLETTGVGLGLTVVQKLLLRSGGAISVRSKLGQGSTFTVLLPQQG